MRTSNKKVKELKYGEVQEFVNNKINMTKTSTKRKAIMKKEDKNKLTNISERKLQELENEMNEHGAAITRLSPAIEFLKKNKCSKKELPKDFGKLNSEILEARYNEGYQAGIDDCESYHADDIDESVEDYHKFNKYGKGVDINWCAILLGALLLGIVYAMITANYNYGLINA